ncbi:STAS domain-containing protein [Polymorphospora sp. NPDC050346]|uniref:STAS domain-containing protein n=1 Tax=Polymorphospora sp. NPDC050346 TaxID=3155780 RepID=UPI0033DE82A9
MFNVQVGHPVADTCVVTLSGELDMMFIGRLREIVDGACPVPDVRWVVVDLHRVSMIDSSAIKELVEAHYAAAGRGQVLLVRNARGMVDRVLRVAGVSAALGMPPPSAGTVYPGQSGPAVRGER